MGEAFGLLEVRRALAEDHAATDVTTRLLGAAADQRTTAQFVAEERFVVAGIPVVETVFRELEPTTELDVGTAEGAWAAAGEVVATVHGSARALLAGERVALNFLQRLCGVATLTRQAVDAVRDTPAHITHTRKTTPGLRTLECYAVRVGGGVENRLDLAAAILWKDNHWAILRASGIALEEALARAPAGMAITVEVETEAELDAALRADVHQVLADNQTPEQIAAWARRLGPTVTIQASGGITAETARSFALAGATLISIGALTHSAPAAAIRCELAPALPQRAVRPGKRASA